MTAAAASALAVEPAVLLMDEPCSALDPHATGHIEELIGQLDEDRVGRLVELGPTATLFSHPADPRTAAYVTGRFG